MRENIIKIVVKERIKRFDRNGVDYVINVIDGGIANNHKYYACCGTINVTVGLFPIAVPPKTYEELHEHATADFTRAGIRVTE